MLSLMHFQILLLSCLFLKLQCVWAVLRSRLVLNCGDQFWVEKSLVLFSGKIDLQLRTVILNINSISCLQLLVSALLSLSII